MLFLALGLVLLNDLDDISATGIASCWRNVINLLSTSEQEQLRCSLRWNRSRDMAADQLSGGCIRLWCWCVSHLVALLKLFHYFYRDTGTGGTIAGTGQFMKMMNDKVMVVLADPEGSGLYNKVGFCHSG